MTYRTSHTWLERGEFSLDRMAPATSRELHFALFADWGSIYVKVNMGTGSVMSYPTTNEEPDWDGVGEWLGLVAETGREVYGGDTRELPDHVMAHLRRAWERTQK